MANPQTTTSTPVSADDLLRSGYDVLQNDNAVLRAALEQAHVREQALRETWRLRAGWLECNGGAGDADRAVVIRQCADELAALSSVSETPQDGSRDAGESQSSSGGSLSADVCKLPRSPLRNGSGQCPHCGLGVQLVRDGGFVLLPVSAKPVSETSVAKETRAERVSAMLNRWNEEDKSQPEAIATPMPAEPSKHDHAWAVWNLHILGRREIRRLTRELVKHGGTGTTPATMAIHTWEHVIRICEEVGVPQTSVLRDGSPLPVTTKDERTTETDDVTRRDTRGCAIDNPPHPPNGDK